MPAVRVAAYSDVEYRQEGGRVYAPESFVLFMARLQTFVDRVTLVGRLDPTPGRSHYPLPEGVGFAALPHYPSLARPWAVLGAMARSLRAFRRLLDDVDAVWLLGPHPLAIAFALLALARRRRLVLGVRQDMPAHMRSRHPRRPDLRLATLALEGAWRLLARRRPLVAVGPDLARRYRADPVVPILIPLVDEDEIVSLDQAFERRYDGQLVALSVGRVDPEKNPLLLSDVLKGLRERDPRWRLVVCGGGSMLDELEQRLRTDGLLEHAELRGYVPLEDGLRRLYRESQAFLHVSWTEGVPQVLFEAFAAGLPVVATAVGGVPEVARDSALLVPPGDAGAAVDALERVAGDAALRRRLAESGLATLRRHSLDRECARVADALRGNGPGGGRW
jgi:glycosyltransferase involved in cell wall biosynthesis